MDIKTFIFLSLAALMAFGLSACKSPTATRLNPSEAAQYSNSPCVNARLVEDEYACFEHHWAEPIEAPGLDNLHRLDNDFYRSAQPESGGFKSAEKLGIKTIISIRETGEDADLDEKEPTDIKLIHMPLSTTKVTKEDVGRVLREVRLAEKPVLIHCRHGSDRTGLISAFYRVLFENWSREEARAELYYGGFGHHTMFDNIPELVTQADLDAIKKIAFSDDPIEVAP